MMNKMIPYQGILDKTLIFRDLSNNYKEVLSNIIKEKKIFNDELIIKKGEINHKVFILFDGYIDVIGYSDLISYHKILSTKELGGVFGDISAFYNIQATADVMARAGSVIFEFDTRELPNNKDLFDQLKEETAKKNFYHLEETNKILLIQFDKGVRDTSFFITIIISFSLGSLFASMTSFFGWKLTLGWSWLFFLFILPLPVCYIILTKQSFKKFGISLNLLRKNLIGGVAIGCLSSILFIAALNQIYNFKIEDLFKAEALFSSAVLYFLHSYIQEFIARGLLQTSLYQIMQFKAHWPSIFISSLLFGSLHSNMGLYVVLLTFISSIGFGFAYVYFRNLLGVSIIHAMLGWVFFSYLIN